MRLETLTVQHLRTHRSFTVRFNHGTTLIAGKNGSGKTSLLEAVMISLRGSSFRSSDAAILRHGDDWYRIDLLTSEGARTVKFDARTSVKKKTFTIDHKNHYRLPERLKYPIVLFEPDDLRVVDGSPSRRRDYLDTMIMQFDAHYAATLRKYDRALFQRNKLLKSSFVSHDNLFPWNVLLSEFGQEIISKRRAVIHSLNQAVTDTYQTIAPTADEVTLHYSHDSEASSGKLLREYEQSIERDMTLKTTTVGPHRHDLLITLNGAKASDTASRGENRTIVLSLKFIEAALIERMTEKKPIVLLDDVFSELDDDRQKLLLKEFQDNQVIMTSATVAARSVKTIVRIPEANE